MSVTESAAAVVLCCASVVNEAESRIEGVGPCVASSFAILPLSSAPVSAPPGIVVVLLSAEGMCNNAKRCLSEEETA